jgi:DNA-binding NtrC family response regulator
MDAFASYSWSGDVRELENMLMKAVALCTGDTIASDFFPLIKAL